MKIVWPHYDYISTGQRIPVSLWNGKSKYPKSKTANFFEISEAIDKKMNFVKDSIRTLQKHNIEITNSMLKDLAYNRVSLDKVFQFIVNLKNNFLEKRDLLL